MKLQKLRKKIVKKLGSQKPLKKLKKGTTEKNPEIVFWSKNPQKK